MATKKRCSNCRAFEIGGKCSLGYSLKPIYFGGIGGPIINGVPEDNCPQPKTIYQLVRAKRKGDKP